VLFVPGVIMTELIGAVRLKSLTMIVTRIECDSVPLLAVTISG
jgi:hypothetical protein